MLGSNLFVVLGGKVGIYIKNQLIATCHVGDAFGEMAVLNKRPRSATATPLTDSRLLVLDESQINEILEKHVAVRLLMNVVHVVSERLEAANTSNVELRKTLQRHGLAVPEPVAGDSSA
jgi:CRP-like cAMP-binding protein